MTGAGLSHLRGLPKLKKLHLDNLTAKQTDGRTFTEAGSQALGTLVQLETLSAARGNLGEPHVRFTEAVGKLANLRRLEIGDGTSISDSHLAALSGLSKLEVVNFSNSRVTGTGLVHLKASSATIKEVHLFYGCPVTDAGMLALAATLPNVERVVLGNDSVCGPDALRALTGLKKLRYLTWMSKTPLANADPAQFALMPALERLIISYTPMTDTGMAGIALCKQLTFLSIANTALTDACLSHLEKLRSLRTLHCGKGTQVTEAGLAAFQKARSDVKVER